MNIQPGFLILLWIQLYSPGAANFQLTILHTNDVHARVEQTNQDSGKCGVSQNCYAGVARRSSKIQDIRGTHQHVLLLDAGDQFQGTIWFNYYKGKEAAYFMNYLQYDAMAIGNHEFDNGVSGLLKPFLEQVKFPVLSANIKADAELAPKISGFVLPLKILQVGSEKIGIVGYTSRETPVLSDPGPHLVFENEITALQPHVDKLLTLGVNKIIALGHSGFETDKLIAQKVKGIDVVVGGHTNTFLYTGSPPSNDVPAGEYPYIVKNDDGRLVPVVQAYAFGKYLGYLNITFDEYGNVLQSNGNPILLDSSIPEDPQLLGKVLEMKEAIKNYSTQVIGKTLVYLNGSTMECRNRECNIGNLICDAMVRSITIEDLISVLPFDGTYDLIEIKGSTLKEAFEHSVHRYGSGTGEFLQVGGLKVVYDITRRPGERVVKLEALCTECRVPKYVPLEKESIYKVVLPNYIAGGGDGFAMLKNGSLKHDSGDTDLTVVSNYITKMGRVYPAVEGRITFLNEEPSSRSSQMCTGSFPLLFLAVFAVLQNLL
ncbi:hypothetical protein GDO86_009827 [Hymenochirus boettgeri]|uniref:5'-nucleotidase n=1 Tax=Hymenochirus boettgeri TaxID=247094 RepID=A0A8T2JN16_9PIPI|nr:hypothetical protein GDO86_009827 [Hymenochirus boettgeri]